MSDDSHKEGKCLACGGMVDDDGMAMLAEMAEGDEHKEMTEAEESPQAEETRRMRDFAKAVSHKGAR